jgi:hypothetical protein
VRTLNLVGHNIVYYAGIAIVRETGEFDGIELPRETIKG